MKREIPDQSVFFVLIHYQEVTGRRDRLLTTQKLKSTSLKTEQFHWWELFVPALNTCMMADYVTSVDYTLYDFQESQIHCAANSDPLTLDWNDENGNYSLFGLTHDDLPDETPFDLLPFSNFLQGFGVLDFA